MIKFHIGVCRYLSCRLSSQRTSAEIDARLCCSRAHSLRRLHSKIMFTPVDSRNTSLSIFLHAAPGPSQYTGSKFNRLQAFLPLNCRLKQSVPFFRIRQVHASRSASSMKTVQNNSSAHHELRGYWSTWSGKSFRGAHQLHQLLSAVEFGLKRLKNFLLNQLLLVGLFLSSQTSENCDACKH